MPSRLLASKVRSKPFRVLIRTISRVTARHLMYFRFECETMFQSTRPRGARREAIFINSGDVAVSIHAPAWGATELHKNQLQWRVVSIHAPAWGATGSPSHHKSYSAVSIHAPAWGATTLLKVRAVSMMFQSTRPRGARPYTCYFQ